MAAQTIPPPHHPRECAGATTLEGLACGNARWVVIAVGAGVLVIGALVTSLWTVQILLVPVVIFGVLLVMLFCPSEKRRR